MATLTVFKFDTADGAEKSVTLCQDLEKRLLVKIIDGAIVTWPEGSSKPKTKQMYPLGAMDQTFWGELFGLIFFVPIFGPVARKVMEVAMGPIGGIFADYGINNDFIKEVRQKVKEGTSAAFLLTESAATDKVAEEFKKKLPKYEILATNLSREQEEKLRASFGV
jgi:uncharacterized membrane protein